VKSTNYIFILFVLFSCEREAFVPNLITEQPIFVSGETIQPVGRILYNSELPISDHGFELSENPDFSAPIIQSLGERSRPGRFTGELSGLEPGTLYYLRAFIDLDGERLQSNVIEIRTLDPGIFFFEPIYALPGQIMEIHGLNFGEDVRVFFDDRPVEIIEKAFESYLRVRIPPIDGNPSPRIRVETRRASFVFDEPFEYMIGKKLRLDFPETSFISDTWSFVENGKLVVGGGLISRVSNSKIWEYDFNQRTWETYTKPGFVHINGFGVSGYFGGGTSSNIWDDPIPIPNFDFWKLENGNLVKKADVPYPAVNSIHFEINDRIYLLGGSIEGTETRLYEYDKGEDEWRRLPDFPFNIQNDMPYFVYKDRLHLIRDNKDLFVFDPATGARDILSQYPGDNSEKFGTASVSGDQLIVGFYPQNLEIWELDMVSLRWRRKANFEGSFLGNNLAFYPFGDKRYLLRSSRQPRPPFGNMEFWEYDSERF